MSDSLHSHGSSTCDSDCCLICQARGKGVKGGDLMSRLWPNERLFGSSGSLAAVPDVISSNKRSPAQSTGAARDVSVPQDCSWFKQAAGKSHSWPQTTEDAGSEGAGLAGSKRTAEAMQKSQSLPQRLSRDGASSSALPSLLVPDNDQPGPCSREDDAQAGAAPRVKRKQPVWDMELSDTDSSPRRQDPALWHFNPDWCERPEPIPARLAPLARLDCAPSSNRLATGSDVLSSIEFSRDGQLLATAGLSKRVRVYSIPDCPDGEESILGRPLATQRLASKLSSLAWSPDIRGVLTVGDYDGVVSQMDVSSGHLLADRDDHSGQRVWGVAHSNLTPHLAASSSSDGTCKLWSGPNLAQRAHCLEPGHGAAVCAASFCSVDANLIALASADACAYIFDLRSTAQPLHVLRGHSRPVSYVRWLGKRVVTASVDSSLAWWDLAPTAETFREASTRRGLAEQGLDPQGVTTGSPLKIRAFRGHSNLKNFTGLAVREADSLLACGSECGSAFVYHRCWSSPLASLPVGWPHGLGAGTAPLLRAGAAVPNASQGSMATAPSATTPSASPTTSTGSLGVPPADPHVRQTPSFVSALAWRPVDACQGRAILAMGQGNGHLSLAALELSPDECSCMQA